MLAIRWLEEFSDFLMLGQNHKLFSYQESSWERDLSVLLYPLEDSEILSASVEIQLPLSFVTQRKIQSSCQKSNSHLRSVSDCLLRPVAGIPNISILKRKWCFPHPQLITRRMSKLRPHRRERSKGAKTENASSYSPPILEKMILIHVCKHTCKKMC